MRAYRTIRFRTKINPSGSLVWVAPSPFNQAETIILDPDHVSAFLLTNLQTPSNRRLRIVFEPWDAET